LHDAVVVAGGATAAQAITVGFSPIITRLYGPEAFGVLGVFTALVGVISPIGALAYEKAIVLPNSDQEARALVRLSFILGIGVAVFTAAVIGAFRYQIGNAMGFGSATPFLLLAPIVVLCSGPSGALQQWLIRKKRFRSMSAMEVVWATVMGASKSGVGLIAATAPILLLLNAAGYALRIILFWLVGRRTFSEQIEQLNSGDERCSKVSLRIAASRYRDFPFYYCPRQLLTALSNGIPAILLAALFNPSAAGYYTLSARVLMLPIQLISDSVGKVFLPKLVDSAHRGEKLQPLVFRATVGLAVTGLLPFGLVIIFGPWLFGHVFGLEWVRAGEYARWLALWLYLWFVSIPCTHAIPVLGMQAQVLVFHFVVSAIRVGSLTFGAVVLRSEIAAIALLSISSAILDFGRNVWVMVRSGNRLRQGIVQRY